MAPGISYMYMQDSILRTTVVQGCKCMHLYIFKSSSSLLVHSSQVPCEYNGIQSSVEWFCSLDEILQASATLPLSGTVYMRFLHLV